MHRAECGQWYSSPIGPALERPGIRRTNEPIALPIRERRLAGPLVEAEPVFPVADNAHEPRRERLPKARLAEWSVVDGDGGTPLGTSRLQRAAASGHQRRSPAVP